MQETEIGTATDTHHVALSFRVEESVYGKEHKDRIELVVQLATMFTLLLSALGGMRFTKTYLGLLIDMCYLRRERVVDVPNDVTERVSVLEETNVNQQHQRQAIESDDESDDESDELWDDGT